MRINSQSAKLTGLVSVLVGVSFMVLSMVSNPERIGGEKGKSILILVGFGFLVTGMYSIKEKVWAHLILSTVYLGLGIFYLVGGIFRYNHPLMAMNLFLGFLCLLPALYFFLENNPWRSSR